MVDKNSAGPGAGNGGSAHAQHIDAERQRRESNPAAQSDALSNQQPDSVPDAAVQSECQPTPVQQPDTRLNDSHEPGSLSAADVEGGISGQHVGAARQSD
jgi:hypothetical protein